MKHTNNGLPQDLRSDRQPEFTQLDIELAFADSDAIMAMMERLMAAVFAKVRRAAQTAVSAASYSYNAAVSGGEHPPQIWLLSANIRSTHLAKGIHTRYY